MRVDEGSLPGGGSWVLTTGNATQTVDLSAGEVVVRGPIAEPDFRTRLVWRDPIVAAIRADRMDYRHDGLANMISGLAAAQAVGTRV